MARVGLALAAVALLFLAGAVQADDAVRKARKMIRSKDVRERLRGVRTLIAIDSADSVRELERVIKKAHKELERGTAAIEAVLDAQGRMLPILERLIAQSNSGANIHSEAQKVLARFDELEARLKRYQIRTRVHMQIFMLGCAGFIRYRDPGAIKVIEQGALMEPNTMLRIFYIGGLRHRSRKASVPALLSGLSGRDPRIRSALVRALIPFAREPGVTEGVRMLAADENWPVRLGAYQVMAGAPFAEAVEFLCGAAHREDGEIALAVDSYLHRLTDQSFSQQPTRWKLWWQENGEAIRAGTWTPAPAPVAKTYETRSVALFFRIPIQSRRILFALDFSGSMSVPTRLRDRQIGKLMKRHDLKPTRLGHAKAEFIRALSALPDGAYFNVVGYSNDVKRLGSGRLMKLSKSTRERAIRWVLRLKTGRLTNIFAAINEVFQDYYTSGGATRFKELPDTVMLLTDGIATRGRFTRARDLMDMTSIWNVPTDIVFHCVGIGSDHDKVLLQGLARQTGGYYVDVDKGLENLAPRKRKMPEGLVIGKRPVAKPKPEEPATPKRAFANGLNGLIDQFEDGDDRQRVAAAQGLGRMGAKARRAAVTLAESLTDFSAEVRKAASEALGKIGSGAVPALIEAIDTDDPDAILGAANALKTIGKAAGRDAMRALVKHVRHADAAVQAAVREALMAMR